MIGVVIPVLVLLVAGLVCITYAIFAPGRPAIAVDAVAKKPRRLFPSLAGVRAMMAVTPPMQAVAAVAAPAPAAVSAINWPLKLDESATDIDDLERLRLIESFTFVPGPWAASILEQAYGEEHAALREAVITAIAECGALAVPVLERALTAESAVERALAVDGYAKIGQLEPVVPLLDDDSLEVAISAGYALARAGRTDVIDAHFAAQADAPRLEEIRGVLASLS